MWKTLSRTAVVIALSVAAFGCAGQSSDDGADDEMIRSAHDALSIGTPKGVAPLAARAVYDEHLGRTMVDLTSNAFPQNPGDPDPHDGDQFLAVLVYVDREGRRDPIEVLTRKDYYGPNGIGPGGGCIHFEIPAMPGDQVFIGGVVKLEGSTRAQLAASPVFTVTAGTWAFEDDPEHHI